MHIIFYLKDYVLIVINVTCVVAHEMWTHWKFKWFFFPNSIFVIFFELIIVNPLKINIFHTLSLKIVKYIILNLIH